MTTLTLPVTSVRFPARCVECGGLAQASYRLVTRVAPLEVPVCLRCTDTKLVKMIAAVVFGVVLGVGVVITIGAAMDAVLGHAGARYLGLIVPLVFVAPLVAPWLLLRRGRRLLHRWLSAVSVRAAHGTQVTLAFANARIGDEVAALSGQVSVTDAPYRAVPKGVAFAGGGQRPPGSPIWGIVVGIVIVGAAYGEYLDIVACELRGDGFSGPTPLVFVYEHFGRIGAVAPLAVIGAAVVVVSTLRLIAARRR